MRFTPCALPPVCSRALSRTRCVRRRRLPPAASQPARQLAPHLTPSFRLWPGRVGVQPAAELRHLQSHKHEQHVRGALLHVSYPESADEPFPTRCFHYSPLSPGPPSPASRPGARSLASHRVPSVRLSAARVGVQPAAELRHLQRHKYGLHAQGALLNVPCTQSAVELSPAHWTPSPLSAGPQPRPAPYGPLSTLGRASLGRRLTSR